MTRKPLRALLSLLALLSACASADSGVESTTSESADTAATSGGESTDAAPVLGVLGRAPTVAELGALMPPDAATPPADVLRVAVPMEGAPARGAASPSVVIVVFSDFQCPFCSRLEPTLARLRSAYPDELRVVFRQLPLPFHDHAQEAAEMSEVAFDLGGNDAFWRVHDLLFQNQRQLEREDLLRYAGAAGLDSQDVAQRLDAHTTRQRVADSASLAQRVGARGTPTSFVNGRPLVGAQPYEAFNAIVQEERALAANEARRGLDRDGLYARRMFGALGRIPAEERPARQARPDVVFRVPVLETQPSQGPADALVTIVEFSDFQCPFCARVEPTLRALRERYGDDLRIVWRNNPLSFHPNARPAAVLAMEAFEQGGNEAFWRVHDLLFENHRELDNIDALARRTGISMIKFQRALARGTHDAAIDADSAAARQLGASGTPAFFINGRNLRGAQPLEAFTAAVDRALAEARAQLAQGTARADVYDALTRDGLTSAPERPARADRPAPSRPQPDRVYDIAVPGDAPSRGAADAPVVIQQFSDFQCPFCSRVEPTLAQLREIYGERIRFVWRNYPLPFHPRAMPAAIAAMEVFRQGGADSFWAYHDMLFAHQREMTDHNLVEWASELRGIRSAGVSRALSDAQARQQVAAEMDPMRAAGARIGTPSFLINGRLLQGSQPLEAFQAAIDRALEEAQQAP